MILIGFGIGAMVIFAAIIYKICGEDIYGGVGD